MAASWAAGSGPVPGLPGARAHLTHIPTPGCEQALHMLGVNVTCDPRFATNKLFVS